MPESFKKRLMPEGGLERPNETTMKESRFWTIVDQDLSPADQELFRELRERATIGGGDFAGLLERITAARIQVPSSELRQNGVHYFARLEMNRVVIVRIDGEGFLTLSDK